MWPCWKKDVTRGTGFEVNSLLPFPVYSLLFAYGSRYDLPTFAPAMLSAPSCDSSLPGWTLGNLKLNDQFLL